MIGFSLWLLAATVSAPAYEAVPVHVREPYVCNLSVVHGLRAGQHLLVRDGPTKGHRALAWLAEGARVYICNEGGGWYGIAFSRPGKPCGDRSSHGLDVRAAARCSSGWVPETWIEILSG